MDVRGEGKARRLSEGEGMRERVDVRVREEGKGGRLSEGERGHYLGQEQTGIVEAAWTRISGELTVDVDVREHTGPVGVVGADSPQILRC